MWRVGQRPGSLSRRVGLWHREKDPGSSYVQKASRAAPSPEQRLLPVLWEADSHGCSGWTALASPHCGHGAPSTGVCPLHSINECFLVFSVGPSLSAGVGVEASLHVISVSFSPSTAQRPGDLCPHHEDNVFGDILCS